MYEDVWVIKRRHITLGELEKIFYSFSISINCKSLCKVKWNLKRVSNFIRITNNYGVENKYDLTMHKHFIL